MPPTLHGTPRSHFTRVVRIVCHELALPIRWVDVGNVGDAEAFGGNPLMQVPVLVDGAHTLWDAHNICCYLVARQGRDPLGIDAMTWSDRNLVATIQGVMSAEVRLILTARAGLDPSGGPLDKAREVLRRGLAWIDERVEPQQALTYPVAWAVSMWDHLLLYDSAQRSDAPRLAQLAEQLAARPSIAETAPS